MAGLVLARKRNEVIVITTPAGEKIEIMNLGHSGNYSRLKVIAPKEFIIKRDEVERKEKLVTV